MKLISNSFIVVILLFISLNFYIKEQKENIYKNNLKIAAQAREKEQRTNEAKKQEAQARIDRENAARRMQQDRSSQQAIARENREDSFCYSLSSSSAREACLGHAYSTNSENAKNIILGNCYSLKGHNSSAMTQVCVNGKNGCYSFNNSQVMNACVQCGGSNRWLRTYAAGSLFNCF